MPRIRNQKKKCVWKKLHSLIHLTLLPVLHSTWLKNNGSCWAWKGKNYFPEKMWAGSHKVEVIYFIFCLFVSCVDQISLYLMYFLRTFFFFYCREYSILFWLRKLNASDRLQRSCQMYESFVFGWVRHPEVSPKTTEASGDQRTTGINYAPLWMKLTKYWWGLLKCEAVPLGSLSGH